MAGRGAGHPRHPAARGDPDGERLALAFGVQVSGSTQETFPNIQQDAKIQSASSSWLHCL